MSCQAEKTAEVAGLGKLILGYLILWYYPKAYECINGHIGKPMLAWYEEVDDDRVNLLVITRCEHCGLPVGGDVYADERDYADFRAGQQPRERELV